MKVLRSVGVFDLSSASAGECRQISIDLVRIGLLSEDAVDLNAAQFQGGEDPNTMIEGGVEIPGSEQDFGTDAPASSSNSGKAPACIIFADQVLKIVTTGSTTDISILQIVLSDINMNAISGKSEQQCRDASLVLVVRGLTR